MRISDTVGDVQEKSFLVIRLRTVKNVEIILPNSMILGAHILNYSVQSEARGLILHTSVMTGYDVPWRTVHQLLVRAADVRTAFLPRLTRGFRTNSIEPAWRFCRRRTCPCATATPPRSRNRTGRKTHRTHGSSCHTGDAVQRI